jgi:hypothetical protein
MVRGLIDTEETTYGRLRLTEFKCMPLRTANLGELRKRTYHPQAGSGNLRRTKSSHGPQEQNHGGR